MAKGVAVHALVVIALIVMLVFFALIVFWKWIDMQNVQANNGSCYIKYSNCCLQLEQGKSCDWANTEPKECEKYGVNEPKTKDACKT